MAILKVRDEQGNVIEIPCIKGEKGERGEKGDSASATDVQINGTSITVDGVADIPIASDKVNGVMKVNRNGGVTVVNETLTLVRGTNASIENRATSLSPIVPSNLDYAVKCAMTDGKGEVWTQDEKAMARERIGIDEWEVLADMTLTEDVGSVTVYTNMNGEAFQVRKMRLTFIGNVTHARLNMFFGIDASSKVENRNMQNTYLYNAFVVNGFRKTVVEIGEKLNNGLCLVTCFGDANPNTSFFTTGGQFYSALPERDKEYLDGIEMKVGATDGLFLTGMRIVVEGVR